MRCKERFCTKLSGIRDIFNNGPRNTHTIICTSSASDFIKNNQTLFCRMTKNVRHLIHLYHKGTLTRCQIIRSTYSCKNTITDTDISRFCRNKASNLCHKRNQCDLTHISRLSSHIRTCNNRNAILSIIKQHIICYKHIIWNHLLNNRMTAIFNIKNSSFINLRFNIILTFCNKRKRCNNVEKRNCTRCFLNTFYLRCHTISHITEQFILKRCQLILSTKN